MSYFRYYCNAKAIFDIPVGQCPSDCARETMRCCLERHRSSYHHSYGCKTALIWIRWTITNCSSGCIAHAFATSITSCHSWLRSGRSLTVDQNFTDWAVRQWRVRLRSCIREGGGHFVNIWPVTNGLPAVGRLLVTDHMLRKLICCAGNFIFSVVYF